MEKQNWRFGRVHSLWVWNHKGGFPQGRNHLQTESQVEDVQNHLTELSLCCCLCCGQRQFSDFHTVALKDKHAANAEIQNR